MLDYHTAMNTYSVLAGRSREALSNPERVVRRAEELLSKAQQLNDDGYLDVYLLGPWLRLAMLVEFSQLSRSCTRTLVSIHWLFA